MRAAGSGPSAAASAPPRTHGITIYCTATDEAETLLVVTLDPSSTPGAETRLLTRYGHTGITATPRALPSCLV